MDLRKRLFSNLAFLLTALIFVSLLIDLSFLRADVKREISASANLMRELIAIGNATCTAMAESDNVDQSKLFEKIQLRHVHLTLDGKSWKGSERGTVERLIAKMVMDTDWLPPQTLVINGHSLKFAPDPTSELQERIEQMGRTLLILLGFSIASITAVWLSADKALKPASTLENFIRVLAEGKDIKQLPNFKLKEYEQLASALNNLAVSLTQARQAQLEFSNKIITAIEAERESIARDLHDELGQTITALNYNGNFAEARSKKSADGDMLKCCSEIRRLTGDLNSQLKSVIKRMRPVGSEIADIIEGINDLIAVWGSDVIGIEFEFYHDDSVKMMSSQQTLNFYRIAQESITNVIRHSQATRCQIIIQKTDNRILLKISDNGIGITNSKICIHGGLYGIRERADMMGAELDVGNGELGGLTIQVSLSYNHAMQRMPVQ